MTPTVTRGRLADDLDRLGVCPGDVLLVHSSFKATGAAEAEDVIGALLDALGPRGTLLLPALSYLQEPRDVHDAARTPTCVGWLAEYFRNRRGTLRSLHPTHSVCGVGARAAELLERHFDDHTPCGPNSPFHLLAHEGGRILMLGCGLQPNTSMHAVEERRPPPYLLGPERVYTITDAAGRARRKAYVTHGFEGWTQRYDRVAEVLAPPDLVSGTVGNAESHLVDAAALCRAGVQRIARQPYYFVDPVSG